ncbi:hypothetical protein SO802_015139 [Lithocarpus litseifolius]|uniref:Aminotransferase-like plant mobile domain-containing protein n=1 Tax=Lithocarpus litseifolius TaxID=425828 RepID=A0AAW2CV91_9ROSI
MHLVLSIQLDHASITAFLERWRLETHTFHLPYGKMTFTLQDVEVIMGLPIEGEAMIGPTKRTWTDVCVEMLGIQIPNGHQTMLKGQRILKPALVDQIRQPLPPDANEIQVHQYARYYILPLQGDMLCNAIDKKAKQIGGPLILVQLWIYVRFPHMSLQMVPKPEGVYGPPLRPIPLAMKWEGEMCTKNAPTHVLSVYRNQIATTWPDQVKWEPYGNDLSHLPPSFRIEGSNVWRLTVPLICFWLVEFHLPDHVLRQFGLNEESYEYKFIKKALEDVNEIDCIDEPANDEAANQTKIPDVGPILRFLLCNASGQFCGVAEMQITGSKIDGVGSKNMNLDMELFDLFSKFS